jgi:hypothetical protein
MMRRAIRIDKLGAQKLADAAENRGKNATGETPRYAAGI